MSVITMADILIFISIENFSLLCTSVRVHILEILELSPVAKELITSRLNNTLHLFALLHIREAAKFRI